MTSVSLPMYTADAFTETQFTGNPAAVCLVSDSQALSEKQRQQIAAEMKITTAFLERLVVTDNFKTANSFSLRWYTPETEINLCGHATLVTAAVLSDVIGNPNKEFSFSTRGGELKTRKENGLVVLNLPQSKYRAIDKKSIASLLKVFCPIERVEEVCYSPEINDLMIRLEPTFSRSEFESLSPEVNELLQHEKYRTVCITTKALDSKDTKGKPYDYFCRVFAPWIGITEDSVTGSSFTMTAPYWQNLLGKSQMHARQCSARGGDVSINILGGGRVELAGAVAMNMSGTFVIKS